MLDQARMHARRVAREARAYAWAIYPSPPATGVRALIFGQGRTGSTLLESLLCSTGHFTKNGEVLGTNGTKGSRILFPSLYLRGLSQRRPAQNFVCHIKLYHLTQERVRAGRRPVEPAAFLRERSAEGWRLIYLRREDKIRHAMSSMVAQARGNFHKTHDRDETVTVHVERDHFEWLVRRRIRFEVEERAALRGLAYHEVVYERDLRNAADHQRTADRVFDYLELERRPVQTQLRKVNARPLREVVSNYEEFAGWVRALGWASSLDEPPGV